MDFPDLFDKLLFPPLEVIAIFDIVFIILTALTCAACAVFAFSYGFFFRWRKRPAGRAQMWTIIALGLFALVILLARAAGAEYPGRLLFTAIVYLGVPVAIIRLIWALWSRYRLPPHRRPGDLPEVPKGFDDTIPPRR